MSSNLPRITTLLDQETFDAVSALSVTLGQSRSALVAEILRGMVPQIRTVLKIQAAATTAKEGLFSDLDHKSERAQKIASEMQEMLDELGRRADELK